MRCLLALLVALAPTVAVAEVNKKLIKTLVYRSEARVDVWDGVRHFSYDVTDETGVPRKVEEHRLWAKGSGYGLLKLAADAAKKPAGSCKNPKWDVGMTLCLPNILTAEKQRELYELSSAPYWVDPRNGEVYQWYVEPALRGVLRPGITDVQVKALIDKLPKECVVALHPWAVEVKYPKCGPTDQASWIWREGWDATNVPKTVDNTHLPPSARP